MIDRILTHPASEHLRNPAAAIADYHTSRGREAIRALGFRSREDVPDVGRVACCIACHYGDVCTCKGA